MVCLSTEIPTIKIYRRGKVRDIYAFDNQLLIIATDRISAFDSVLPNGIPHKGAVLTQLSKFWFHRLESIVKNHFISTALEDYPHLVRKYREIIDGRSMLVRKVDPLPIECVVRGYLTGSGWKDYVSSGSVCGIGLRPGLRECDKLDEPIFTPSTKAEAGHDINISFEEMASIVGVENAIQLRAISLVLYKTASEYTEQRGIIISDTKFEFGIHDGQLMLIDEVLTPDSSRFWPSASYRPGRPQPSFDKQFVRDYLESVEWNKQPPAPPLPDEVIRITSQKYLDAYKMITGKELQFRQ